jgi:hypothetical protein
MDKPLDRSKKRRPRVDVLGTFGFAVLIATIVYAVLTVP